MPKIEKRKNSRFRCCVCYENSLSLSYFAFPRKENIRQQWLSFFNLQSNELVEHSKVCSKHFKEDDYFLSTKDGRVKLTLKKDKIPTLLPSKGELTRKVGVQRCVLFGPSDGFGNRCYFPFPIHSDEIFQQWLQFCELTPEEILPSHRLCSDHFIPDFINGSTAFCKRRSLNPNAIPSLRYDISRRNSVIQVICRLNENNQVCDESVSGEIGNDFCQSETPTNDNEVQPIATVQKCTPEQRDICSQQVEMNIEFKLLNEDGDGSNLMEIESRNSSNRNEIADPVVLPSTPTSSQHPCIPKRLGDIHTPHLSTPRRARACFNLAKNKLKEKSRTIKTLTQCNARLRKRITMFKTLVGHLKKKNLISEQAHATLMQSIPEGFLDVMQRKSGGRGLYSSAIRKFALTLKFYSSKAYKYVRKVWGNLLPAPSTIRKWLMIVNGSPGFTQESFSTITARATTSNSSIPISLVMDEMSIRQQLLFKNNKQYGCVDFGNNLLSEEGDDNVPTAKNALVFLAVSLKFGWKIPIGYFLIDGLTGKERANLINIALQLLHDAKAEVLNITFDGASVNISTAEQLGAVFEYSSDKFKPWIHHPVTRKEVYIIIDPSHIIKLVRNTLGESNFLQDVDGHRAKWSDVCTLFRKQTSIGLHFATKLTNKHLNYSDNIMNVKLAAQTLSSSVADALKYCREEKISGFENTVGTEIYCKMMDCAFDILNCRSKFSKKPHMIPLMEMNQKFLHEATTKIIQYVKELKLCVEVRKQEPSDACRINVDFEMRNILNSRRKTGFLGIIVDLTNIFNIYKALKESGQEYLLTYKLSQDHLESFFGCIRSRGGHNNNPNAFQFESAYKQLIVHNEVQCSENSNVSLDSIPILHVSSGKNIKKDSNQDQPLLSGPVQCSDSIPNDTITPTTSTLPTADTSTILDEETEEEIDGLLTDVEELHDVLQKDKNSGANSFDTITGLLKCVEDIVIYIAGFAAMQVNKNMKCESCSNWLEGNLETTSNLLKIKNRGGLTVPSEDVVILCIEMEQYLRNNPTSKYTQSYFKRAQCSVLENSSSRSDIYNEDDIECTTHLSHIHTIKGLIVEKFYKIRVHHNIKILSEKSKYTRQNYNKLILFKGQ